MLTDATTPGMFRLVKVIRSWDDCIIPSRRPLHEIMADIVQHGVDYPRHGIGCACMDKFSYEIKAHIARVLPDVERAGGVVDAVSSERNWAARSRIAHVLGMVTRSL